MFTKTEDEIVSSLRRQLIRQKQETSRAVACIVERDAIIEDLRARARALVVVVDGDKEPQFIEQKQQTEFTYPAGESVIGDYDSIVCKYYNVGRKEWIDVDYTITNNRIVIDKDNINNDIYILIKRTPVITTIDGYVYDQGVVSSFIVEPSHEFTYEIKDWKQGASYHVSMYENVDGQIVESRVEIDGNIIRVTPSHEFAIVITAGEIKVPTYAIVFANDLVKPVITVVDEGASYTPELPTGNYKLFLDELMVESVELTNIRANHYIQLKHYHMVNDEMVFIDNDYQKQIPDYDEKEYKYIIECNVPYLLVDGAIVIPHIFIDKDVTYTVTAKKLFAVRYGNGIKLVADGDSYTQKLGEMNTKLYTYHVIDNDAEIEVTSNEYTIEHVTEDHQLELVASPKRFNISITVDGKTSVPDMQAVVGEDCHIPIDGSFSSKTDFHVYVYSGQVELTEEQYNFTFDEESNKLFVTVYGSAIVGDIRVNVITDPNVYPCLVILNGKTEQILIESPFLYTIDAEQYNLDSTYDIEFYMRNGSVIETPEYTFENGVVSCEKVTGPAVLILTRQTVVNVEYTGDANLLVDRLTTTIQVPYGKAFFGMNERINTQLPHVKTTMIATDKDGEAIKTFVSEQMMFGAYALKDVVNVTIDNSAEQMVTIDYIVNPGPASGLVTVLDETVAGQDWSFDKHEIDVSSEKFTWEAKAYKEGVELPVDSYSVTVALDESGEKYAHLFVSGEVLDANVHFVFTRTPKIKVQFNDNENVFYVDSKTSQPAAFLIPDYDYEHNNYRNFVVLANGQEIVEENADGSKNWALWDDKKGKFAISPSVFNNMEVTEESLVHVTYIVAPIVIVRIDMGNETTTERAEKKQIYTSTFHFEPEEHYEYDFFNHGEKMDGVLIHDGHIQFFIPEDAEDYHITIVPVQLYNVVVYFEVFTDLPHGTLYQAYNEWKRAETEVSYKVTIADMAEHKYERHARLNDNLGEMPIIDDMITMTVSTGHNIVNVSFRQYYDFQYTLDGEVKPLIHVYANEPLSVEIEPFDEEKIYEVTPKSLLVEGNHIILHGSLKPAGDMTDVVVTSFEAVHIIAFIDGNQVMDEKYKKNEEAIVDMTGKPGFDKDNYKYNVVVKRGEHILSPESCYQWESPVLTIDADDMTDAIMVSLTSIRLHRLFVNNEFRGMIAEDEDALIAIENYNCRKYYDVSVYVDGPIEQNNGWRFGYSDITKKEAFIIVEASVITADVNVTYTSEKNKYLVKFICNYVARPMNGHMPNAIQGRDYTIDLKDYPEIIYNPIFMEIKDVCISCGNARLKVGEHYQIVDDIARKTAVITIFSSAIKNQLTIMIKTSAKKVHINMYEIDENGSVITSTADVQYDGRFESSGIDISRYSFITAFDHQTFAPVAFEKIDGNVVIDHVMTDIDIVFRRRDVKCSVYEVQYISEQDQLIRTESYNVPAGTSVEYTYQLDAAAIGASVYSVIGIGNVLNEQGRMVIGKKFGEEVPFAKDEKYAIDSKYLNTDLQVLMFNAARQSVPTGEVLVVKFIDQELSTEVITEEEGFIVPIPADYDVVFYNIATRDATGLTISPDHQSIVIDPAKCKYLLLDAIHGESGRVNNVFVDDQTHIEAFNIVDEEFIYPIRNYSADRKYDIRAFLNGIELDVDNSDKIRVVDGNIITTVLGFYDTLRIVINKYSRINMTINDVEYLEPIEIDGVMNAEHTVIAGNVCVVRIPDYDHHVTYNVTVNGEAHTSFGGIIALSALTTEEDIDINITITLVRKMQILNGDLTEIDMADWTEDDEFYYYALEENQIHNGTYVAKLLINNEEATGASVTDDYVVKVAKTVFSHNFNLYVDCQYTLIASGCVESEITLSYNTESAPITIAGWVDGESYKYLLVCADGNVYDEAALNINGSVIRIPADKVTCNMYLLVQHLLRSMDITVIISKNGNITFAPKSVGDEEWEVIMEDVTSNVDSVYSGLDILDQNTEWKIEDGKLLVLSERITPNMIVFLTDSYTATLIVDGDEESVTPFDRSDACLIVSILRYVDSVNIECNAEWRKYGEQTILIPHKSLYENITITVTTLNFAITEVPDLLALEVVDSSNELLNYTPTLTFVKPGRIAKTVTCNVTVHDVRYVLRNGKEAYYVGIAGDDDEQNWFSDRTFSIVKTFSAEGKADVVVTYKFTTERIQTHIINLNINWNGVLNVPLSRNRKNVGLPFVATFEGYANRKITSEYATFDMDGDKNRITVEQDEHRLIVGTVDTNIYTITFMKKIGEQDPTEIGYTKGMIGDVFVFPLPGTVENYEFDGWFNNGSLVEDLEMIIRGDDTFYAVFKIIRFEIDFTVPKNQNFVFRVTPDPVIVDSGSVAPINVSFVPRAKLM